MIIKWETGGWSKDLIRRIQCKKETEHTVTLVNGRRQFKQGSYEQIHDSWEDAKKYLLERAKVAAEEGERLLMRANADIAEICSLEAPVNG